MKCRVFTASVGWSDVMFIFDLNTKFSEIKKHPNTKILNRNDYVGTYDFDKKFINFFDKRQIGDKLYFYRHSYDKDNDFKVEKVKNVEVKNVKNEDIKDDGSFDNFDSLF